MQRSIVVTIRAALPLESVNVARILESFSKVGGHATITALEASVESPKAWLAREDGASPDPIRPEATVHALRPGPVPSKAGRASKLSEKDRDQIAAMLKAGAPSQHEIATRFGVSRSLIAHIAKSIKPASRKARVA